MPGPSDDQGGGLRPDNTLPVQPTRPDQGLPGQTPRPDQEVPPPLQRPDQTLPVPPPGLPPRASQPIYQPDAQPKGGKAGKAGEEAAAVPGERYVGEEIPAGGNDPGTPPPSEAQNEDVVEAAKPGEPSRSMPGLPGYTPPQPAPQPTQPQPPQPGTREAELERVRLDRERREREERERQQQPKPPQREER